MKISNILTVLLAHCCLNREKIKVYGATARPNIVLIFADDVGTGEVPGYWNTGKVDMPNIQNLVDTGTVFTDVHSTPLCAPSRYVLLSGNYQHRGSLYKGTWQVNYESGQFRDGQQSIANVLSSSGYHTAMTGKWHLGGKVPLAAGFIPGNNMYVSSEDMLTNINLDWTKPLEKGSPEDLGFDSSLMSFGGIQGGPYKQFRNGKFEDLSDIRVWEKGTYSMAEGMSTIQKKSEGSPDWDSTAFNMIQVNETARFLDDHIQNRKDDPFFAYIALGTVHTPHTPPIVYMDGTPVAGQYETAHLDVLGEMDKVVGSIVQHLDDRQLLQDTIVIFTSDNGGLGPKYTEGTGHNGSGPLRGAKGQIYEGGHRVPMIMRWDNGPIPANETRSHLMGLNDVFATLSQFASVDVPAGQAIDSVSFADYIENEANTANLRKHLGVWAVKDGRLREESIRQNNLKLIRSRVTGAMFLYDLDKDISETTNLINDATYNDAVSEMMVKLKEISPCYDNQGTFNVAMGGSSQSTTCAWFAQQRERCNTYDEGQLECRLTCAGRSKNVCRAFPPGSPTSSPVRQIKVTAEPSTNPTSSTAPTGACTDSKLQFKVVKDGKKITRDCIWVFTRDTENRCNLPTVSSMCPDTCGTCVNCGDRLGRFKVFYNNQTMFRDCIWVSNKQVVQRCAITHMKETCSKTCDSSCGR